MPHALVTVVVDDYDEAVRFYVDTLGFEVREDTPPRQESYGTVAVFEDLYGTRWDLVERNRPVADSGAERQETVKARK